MVENHLKNQSMKHLPHKLLSHTCKHDTVILSTVDSSRVCITSDEVQSDYICANYIDVRILEIYT